MMSVSRAVASPSRSAYWAAWPTVHQELLLKAALLDGQAAIDGFTDWESAVNWDDHLEEAPTG
jgi:hypothetical protein